jgi:hypothetical protein
MSIKIDGTEYYNSVRDYLETNWLIEKEDELNRQKRIIYPLLSRDMKYLNTTEYFYMDTYINDVFVKDINELILDLDEEYIMNYENPVVYYHDELGIVIEDIDNLKRTRNGNFVEEFIDLTNDNKTPIEILYELIHIRHGNIVNYKENE